MSRPPLRRASPRPVPPRPVVGPPLRPGQKVTVTFREMDAEGRAVGSAGGQTVAVPFAIPGEEALVEIVRAGRPARGRIAALVRKSPEAAVPRCRHFGVCGGCQWQHLAYEAQLRHKVALLQRHLAPILEPAGVAVAPAIPGEPWAYRSRLQAAFAMRQDRLVAGFHAAAEDLRIINVRECPIQREANVQALAGVRDVVAALGWPVYDHLTRRGLVRGVVVQHGAATGEVMVVLSAAADLPDRMAFVRAVREAVPGLVSLILSVQPRRTAELLGRLQLLWGRPYIEEQVDGLRLRLFPRAAMPPTPAMAPRWLEAIAQALEVGEGDVIVDTACEEGLAALWLARRARRVIGIAPDREAMHRAWEHARMNAIDRCVFYTRAPERVVERLRARGQRLDAALLASRRAPLAPGLLRALAEAGAERLAVTGASLPLLAQDLRVAQAAGYRVRRVQPVDLLPQTSRVTAVASLVRTGGT